MSGSIRRTRGLAVVAFLALISVLPVPVRQLPIAEAAVLTSFTPPAFTANDTGAIDAIGNTLMSCPASASCTSARAGANVANNSFAMVLIDQDGTTGAGASTTNSSMSRFTLPSGSTVLWAGLYWGATSTAAARNQLAFRPPGAAAYQTVTGTLVGTGSDNYHAFANVTALVAAAGSGDYWAGNIRAQTGGGLYAGWSLVVAYRNPGLPMRNLTIFDGYAVVQNTTADRAVNVDVSGFLTPPFGAVNAEVGVVAYEGDRGSTGDQLLLSNNGSLTSPTFTALSNAANPVNDVFNSSISDAGVSATDGNPAYVNQLGFDIDEFATAGVLPNSSTQARLRFLTGGETYFPGVLTFAVDLYAPAFPAVTKSVVDINGGLTEPGDTLEYTISLTNVGLDPALNSVLRDVIPVGTTFVPGSITVEGAAQTDAANTSTSDRGDYLSATRTVTSRAGTGATSTAGGTLNPNASTTTKFRVTVNAAAAGSTLSNTGAFDFTAQTIGQDYTFSTNTVKTPVEPRADLVVTKRGSPDPVTAGEDVTWTIDVTNNGPNPAQGVVATDSLPSGMTLVSATWPDGTCTGSAPISCAIGSVDDGTTTTVTVVATADSALAPGTVLANRASATSTTVDVAPGNETGNASVKVVTAADLRVTKTSSVDPIVPGQPVTYTMVVTNDGPSVADDASLTDVLPSELTATSLSSDVGSCTLASLRCEFGDLSVGQSATVTLVASTDPALTTSITNVARTTSATTDADLDDNSVSVTTPVAPRADVTVDKITQTSPVGAGGSVRWRIVVTNTGPSTAAGVTLSDPAPAGISVVSASSTAGTCTATVSCALGSIGPGASATVTIDATVSSTRTGSLVNTATAATTTPEPVGGGADNTDSTFDLVVRNSDLKIAKSASPQPFVAGAAGTYTITVVNNGPSASSVVTVTDPLPAGFNAGSPTTTGGGSCNLTSGTLTCSYAAGLAVGASATITVPGTIAAGAGSLADNVATVTAATDLDTSNNSASVSTSLATIADVAIDKEWDQTTVEAGASASLTLAVRNAGPSNTSDPLTVSDAMPAGVTLGSPLPAGCEASTPTQLTCSIAAVSAGTTTSLAVPVVISATAPAGTITNSATVTILGEDPNSANNADSDTIAVTRRAQISIDKSVASPTAVAGQMTTYTVTVTNAGPSTAETTTITDQIPAGLTLVTPLPAGCSHAGGTLTCAIGTLDPSGPASSATVTYQAVLDPSLDEGTVVRNEATAASLTPGTTPVSAAAELTTVTRADLGIDKVAGQTTVTAGQPLSWTMTVTNAGPSDAENISVSDAVPAGFVVGQVTPSVGGCASLVAFPCVVPTLAAGASFTVTVTGTVAASQAAGPMSNTATVAAATAEPAGATLANSDTATATVDRLADLVLTKDASPTELAAGDGPLTYTITVANRGPSDSVATVVSDVLPADFVVASVSPSACAEAGGIVTCDFGTMTPTTPTQVVTIIGSLRSTTPPGPLVNTASVTSGTPLRNPTDDSDSATVTVTQRADVWLSKSATPVPVSAGSEITYVVTVGNDGPSPATGVGFSDTLPAEIDPATIVVTPGDLSCIVTGASVECHLAAALAPGDTLPVTIRATTRSDLPAGVGVISNTATVTSATADTNAANDSQTATTDVITVADLATTKVVSPDLVAGDPVTWTITVTNHGPSDAAAVSISDVIPASAIDVTVTPSVGSCATFPCALGTIASGATETIEVQATIDPAFLGESITNTAQSTSTTFDPQPGNDASTVTAPVLRSADLSIVKSAAPDAGPVVAGEAITYTLTVDNDGPTVARAATISDTLPSGVVPVPPLPAGCALAAATISCALGDLAPADAAVTRTFIVTTNADLPSGSIIGNSAGVSSATNDAVSSNNTSSVTTQVDAVADLRLVKTPVGAPFTPGTDAAWDIEVFNDGPSVARSVSVSDPSPTGFTPTSFSAPGGVTCTLGAISSCSLGDLPASASPVVIRINGTLAADLVGSIDNTAEVSSATTDLDTADNSATSTTPLSPLADVTITKAVVTDPVVPGEPVRFRLLVRNLGPSTAADVTVTDALPAGMTFVAASTTSGTCSSTTAVCTIGLLPPNPTPLAPVEILVDATIAAGRTGSFSNNASVATSTTEPSAGGAADSASAGAAYAPSADLRVTKVGPNVAITAGTAVTYLITVTNDGPSDAVAVEIDDALPAQVVNAALVPDDPDGSCTAGSCSWPFIESGGSRTVTVTGEIASGATATDPNVVTVTSATADPEPANDTASADVDTVARADLSLVKSGPATAVAGTSVTYVLTVENAGSSDAVDVVVTDTLPDGVTVTSVSSSQGSCTALPCTLGTLVAPAPGDPPTSATVTVEASVPAGHPAGAITNRAAVTSSTVDDDPSDNRDLLVTEITRATDIVVDKTAVSPTGIVGEHISFDISVANPTGPSTAESVSISDDLPPGTSFVGASATSGTANCTENLGQLSCSVGTLDVGAPPTVIRVELAVDQAVADGTVIANTATGSTITPQSDLADDEAAADVTVDRVADLGISKTVSPATVDAGRPATWTIVVTNHGPSEATAVEVTDALPAGFSIISVSDSLAGCTATGQDLTCDPATLADGATWTISITGTVDATVPAGPMVNTAAVTKTEPDPASPIAADTDDATLTVTTLADLEVTKSAAPDPVIAGNLISWTIRIRNHGPSDAQSVAVADLIPAGLSTSPTVSGACTALPCVIPTIAASTESLVTIRALVSPSYLSDEITNTVKVGSPTDPTGQTAEVTSGVISRADLSLAKTVEPSSEIIAGETLTWTLEIANSGSSDAVDTVLTDILPIALLEDVSAPGCAIDGITGVVSCPIGTVAAGSGANRTITARLRPSVVVAQLANTASVTSATTDVDLADQTASTNTPITTVAELTIAKSGTDATAGELTTWTITIGNDGPSHAQDVVVTDTLPADLLDPEILDPLSGCSVTSGVLTCDLDTVPTAGRRTVVVRGRVSPSHPAGPMSNTAAVASTTPDPGVVANQATAEIAVTTAAELGIDKQGPATAVPGAGDSVTYTIRVHNAGPSVAAAVTVDDTLPADVVATSIVPSQGTCTAFPCLLGDLADGAEATIVVIASVDAASLDPVTNTASVTSTTPDPALGNESSSVDTALTPSADLAITKTASVDPVVAGETVTYSIRVVNNGPSVARAVQVTDPLPSGVFVDGALPAGCSETLRTIDCDLGDLPAGSSVELPITVLTDGGLAEGSTLLNTAEVAGSTPDPMAGNDEATSETSVVTEADVQIVKTAPAAPFVPGTPATWQLTVTNDGPSTARSVQINDTPPAGFTATSFAGPPGVGCTLSASVSCTLGDIAADAAPVVVTITGNVAAAVTGELSNRAVVTSTTADDDPTDNSSTATATTAPLADLEIGKRIVTSPVVPGRPVRFEITVRNLGPSTAADVVLTDELPADLVYQGATTTSGECSFITGVLTCPLGDLAPNPSPAPPVTVVVDALVDADASGTLANTAAVSTTTPEGGIDPGPNSTTASAPLAPAADLRVVKLAPNVPIVAGTPVTYTVAVYNDGPSDAQAVTLADTLPAQVVGAAVSLDPSSADGSCAAMTCTWPTIPAGGSRTMTIIGTIAAGVTATDANSVAATSTTPDPLPANNTARADVDTITRAEISLDKSGPATATAGDALSYSIVVRNAGPSDAANLIVDDVLPAGLVPISVSPAGANCTIGAGGNPQRVRCVVGTLAAPASPASPTTLTIAIDAEIDVDQPAGPVNNSATATSTTVDDDPSDNRDTVTTAIGRSTDLTLVKVPIGTTGVVGEQVSYDITVANPTGPSSAEGVVVADPLPVGTRFVSAVARSGAATCGDTAGTISCSLGTMAPGETTVVRVTVEADADVADGATLTNTARVSTVTPQTSTDNDSDSADILVARQADLGLVKTVAPTSLAAGEPAVWTIVVTNAGPSDASGVEISDTIPVGFVITAVSDSLGACSATGADLECAAQELPNGATWTVTVAGRVSAAFTGTSLTNTATVDAATPEPASATEPNSDEAVMTTEQRADLVVRKTAGPDSVIAGEPITWTITIDNQGPSDARDVVVTDAVPASIVGAVSVAGACNSLPCSIPLLASGTSATLTVSGIVVEDLAAATITNTATAISPTDPTTNSATVTSGVRRLADLSLTKRSSPIAAIAGQPIVWTLTAGNGGSSTADDVVVRDQLPIGSLTDVEVPVGCVFGAVSGMVTCTEPTLAAGAEIEFAISAIVRAGVTATELVNTASVTSTTDDADLADQQATLHTLLGQQADLGLVKTGTDAAAGESTRFTMVVTNHGPSDAQSVRLTDQLPVAALDPRILAPSVGCMILGGELTCDLDALPSGATTTIVVEATVDPSFGPGPLSNTASVVSDTTDLGVFPNASTATIAVAATAAVSITKSGPATAVPGEPIEWTITVANAGPSEARDVVVGDLLPTAVTVTAVAPSQGICTGFPCPLGTIPPGREATIRIEGMVSDDALTSVVNQASVTTSTVDSSTGDDIASASTEPAPVADLSITKTAAPIVVAGQTLTYQLSVINHGPSTARTVVVTDPLPSGTSISGSLPSGCTSTASEISCDLGDLAPSMVPTVRSVTLTVGADLLTGSTITNAAVVSSLTADPAPGNDRSSVDTGVDARADLVISKVALDEPFVPGTPVRWQLTVANPTGPSTARAVRIEDVAPAGFTPSGFSSSSAATDCTIAATVDCSLGDLDVGADPVVITIVGDLAVDLGDGAATTIENTAVVTSSTVDDDTSDNRATASASVAPAADVSITKSILTDPVVPGEPIRFEVTVRNAGPSTAAAVAIGDVLPAGLSFVSASSTLGTCSETVPGTVTCALGELAPNPVPSAPVRILIDATVDAAVDGTLSNTATVSTTTAEAPGGAANSATTSADYEPSADLRVVKTAPQVVLAAGTPAEYTVTVTNDGPSDAVEVHLTDPLPAALTYTGGLPADCTIIGGEVDCAWPRIPVGESRSFTIAAAIDPGATEVAPNTATIEATTADPSPGNDSSTADVDATTIADLVMVKSAPATVAAGDQLSYVLTVTNNGPSNATAVEVVDSLPVGVAPVATDTPGCVISGQQVSCSFAGLSVGTSTTIRITAVVAEDHLAGPISNTAAVTSQTPDDDPDSNRDTAVTTVTRQADLAVSKTAVTATGVAGRQIAYDLVVSNADGPSSAELVSLSDRLPAGTSFVTATLEPSVGASCGEAAGVLSCDLGEIGRGEQVTIHLVLSVDPTVADGATILNAATASTITPQSDTTDDSDDAAVTIAREADLGIVKTSLPSEANAGDPVRWRIVITNHGPSEASGVAVSDMFPAGFRALAISDSRGACSPTGTSLSCTPQVLAVGATWTVTIDGSVAPDTLGNLLTNGASVVAVEAEPADAAFPNSATADLIVDRLADLTLTKSATPDPVIAGETIGWTITVGNDGPSDARDVVIDDVLPAGLVPGSLSVSGGSCTALPCTIPTLVAGARLPIVVTAGLASSYASSELVNMASATSPTDPSPASASSSSAVTRLADLSIVKTATPSVLIAGEQVLWTLTVHNDGSSDATDVVVSDTLPMGRIETVSATGCTGPSLVGLLVCVLDVVPAGEERTITITADVRPDQLATSITNTATVASSTPDADTADAIDSVTTPLDRRADLEITKAGTDAVAGEATVWTIEVANHGPSDAQSVTISDLLPESLVDASVLEPVTGCTIEGRLVSCALDTIPDGGMARVRLGADVAAGFTGTAIDNSVTVSSATLDPSLGSNTATGTIATTTAADLRISKIGPSSATPGVAGGIEWVVTVVNAGPSVARDVVISDVIPASVAVSSIRPTQGACAAMPCALGDIPPTGSAAVTITGTVLPGELADISNTATVTSSTSERTPGDETSTSTTELAPTAAIRLDKVGPASVVAGEQISWTIEVANDGPSVARSVQLADVLPAGLIGSPTIAGDCATLPCALGDLDPTAVRRVTISGLVDPARLADLTNAATATSPTPAAAGDDRADTTIARVTSAASLTATKTGQESITPGVVGGASWTITVANAGPSDALGVTVADVLPAGITLVSLTPSQGGCSAFPCLLGRLAAGTTATIELVGTLDADADPATSPLANTATVSSTTADPNSADDSSTAYSRLDPRSELSVVKTGPATATAGTIVEWTITVTNAGPSTARSVVLSDQMPAWAVSPIEIGGDCAEFPCLIGDLRSGQSRQIVVSARLSPDATDSLTNLAEISTTTPPPAGRPGRPSDEAVSDIETEASIVVSKRGPAVVTPGQPIAWEIEVRNDGPSTARSVVLDDQLPTGVDHQVTVAGACTVLPCELGDLAVGDSALVVVTAATLPSANGNLSNTAVVTSPTPGGPTDQRSASAVTATDAIADLSLTKVLSGSTGGALRWNTEATYLLTVHNAGPSQAADVVVSDVLPPGLALVSATSGGHSCTVSGNVVSCPIGAVAPGSDAVVAVTVRAVGTGAVVNTASVQSPTPDPTTNDLSATASSTIVRLADLRVTKTGAATPADARAINFVITVRNLGPDEAAAVEVVEHLPEGMTVTSTVPTKGSYDSVSNRWTIGSMAAGETVTLDLLTRTIQLGQFTNRVSVSAAVTDSTTDDDAASAAVTTTSAGGRVPETGADVLPYLTIGSGLVLTGLVLVLGGRRRRRPLESAT